MELWMSIIGISMAMSGIPQIMCLLKRKTSDDLSIITWLIVVHGQGWWLNYGIHKKSISLIIANIVGLMFTVSISILIIKYRRQNNGQC